MYSRKEQRGVPAMESGGVSRPSTCEVDIEGGVYTREGAGARLLYRTYRAQAMEQRIATKLRKHAIILFTKYDIDGESFPEPEVYSRTAAPAVRQDT